MRQEADLGWRREWKRWVLPILLVIVRCIGSTSASAEPPVQPDLPFTRADVMFSLDQSLVWYQQARVSMRSINETAGSLFAREDEQTVLRILERAFEKARAQSALLSQASVAGANDSPARPAGRQADERARLQTEIRRDEEEVTRLRARLRAAPGSMRVALQRQLVATSNQIALNRLRLDFLTKIGQLDSPSADGNDLEHQIQALRDTVPELQQSDRVPAAVNAPRVDLSSTGTWGLIHRLLELQRGRSSLKEIMASTSGLTRDVDAALGTTRASVRPALTRLRALAKDPAPDGASLDDGAREFRGLLDRVKLLSGVVLPLREESTLLHRFAKELDSAGRAIDRASGQALQGMLLQLTGVAVALGVIIVGAVLWRVAAFRYVTDRYRRRLVMIARNVAVVGAIVLVILFHFTTELAALVTVLGFAAAGIAFALQNVILAVAGYFSIVAPNGIRLGDRVSLQGPFGYVHGEVIDLGILRLRLRELAGDDLHPTGRIVVFPNSVVFTGSFFKHPPGEPEPA
jgi:hypothetical protein